MEYNLKVGDNAKSLTIELGGEDRLSAVIGERSYDVSYTRISDHQIHLNINGRGHVVSVDGGADAKTVMIQGNCLFVEDTDALRQQGRKKRMLKQGPKEITPPMPAVVIQIMVSEGARVEKGQGIAVIAAMKMETTLYAPFDGTITSVNVDEGDKVMPGKRLVDIKALD